MIAAVALSKMIPLHSIAFQELLKELLSLPCSDPSAFLVCALLKSQDLGVASVFCSGLQMPPFSHPFQDKLVCLLAKCVLVIP